MTGTPVFIAVMTSTTSVGPWAITRVCIAAIKPRSPHANLGVWCNLTARVLICWSPKQAHPKRFSIPTKSTLARNLGIVDMVSTIPFFLLLLGNQNVRY